MQKIGSSSMNRCQSVLVIFGTTNAKMAARQRIDGQPFALTSKNTYNTDYSLGFGL